LARIAARSLGGGLAETILGLWSDKALGKGREGRIQERIQSGTRGVSNSHRILLRAKIEGVKRCRTYIGCPETMYPDMVRDFLGRATVSKEGGTKMTNAHGIIWIEECNFHRRPVFGKFNTPYRACVGQDVSSGCREYRQQRYQCGF
jgi:hypothetical protein